jgi:hypothetical protein
MCLKHQILMEPNGKLAKYIYAKINRVYKNVMPRIYSELEQMASDAGESSSGLGNYNNMYIGLQMNLGAMGEHYGLLKPSAQPTPAAAPSEPNMNLDAIVPGGGPSDTMK